MREVAALTIFTAIRKEYIVSTTILLTKKRAKTEQTILISQVVAGIILAVHVSEKAGAIFQLIHSFKSKGPWF